MPSARTIALLTAREACTHRSKNVRALRAVAHLPLPQARHSRISWTELKEQELYSPHVLDTLLAYLVSRIETLHENRAQSAAMVLVTTCVLSIHQVVEMAGIPRIQSS